MQTPTDQEIQERFDDLPQEVRAAIQSADMTTALSDVGHLHGLHVDQLGALEDETLLVMLGFANPAAFAGRVEAALAVDAATAQAIAEEVSAKLFVPIRSAMRAYMEERLKHTQQGANNSRQTTVIPLAVAKTPSMDQPVPAAPQPALNAAQGTPAAPQVTTRPVPQEGKIIMPAGVEPTVHPIDQMLARPTITTPATVDYGMPGALQTPATPRAMQYATDPYREPVE